MIKDLRLFLISCDRFQLLMVTLWAFRQKTSGFCNKLPGYGHLGILLCPHWCWLTFVLLLNDLQSAMACQSFH